MAVSIRRSPQPFQASVWSLVAAGVIWLVLGIAVGGSVTNVGMALFGVALAVVGVSLVLNINRCADYMRASIRKDAPYRDDYFRYALAEGAGGVRVPGLSLAVIGVVVAGYAVAALAS